MFVELSSLQPADRYRLIIGLVVPRPIAWVSTIDKQGRVNLAPYSFFNAVSATPPVVVFAPALRRDGSKKDTLLNIEATESFVVNVATEPLSEEMNATSAELGYGVSEAEAAGLSMVPSSIVAPPRVGNADAALECRLMQVVPLGEGPSAGNLVIGEILAAHVNDSVLNPETGQVDPSKLRAIGRLNGNYYCRSTDLFELDRPR